jgi:hypothetical protein
MLIQVRHFQFCTWLYLRGDAAALDFRHAGKGEPSMVHAGIRGTPYALRSYAGRMAIGGAVAVLTSGPVVLAL